MSLATILGTAVSLVIGGAVAVVTVMGLVSSQTGPDEVSPANVENPVVQYGSVE